MGQRGERGREHERKGSVSLSLLHCQTHTHGVCEQDSHTLTARLRSQYTEVCSERERERERKRRQEAENSHWLLLDTQAQEGHRQPDLCVAPHKALQ